MLFDSSVRDNIAMNAPDATDEEVIHAARVACMPSLDLPQDMDQALGTWSCSWWRPGQRIAIARAILSRPRMLILDEATSALDYLTERTVCENLRRELSGDTVFFITHRLANPIGRLNHVDGKWPSSGSWLPSAAFSPQGSLLRLYRQQDASIN